MSEKPAEFQAILDQISEGGNTNGEETSTNENANEGQEADETGQEGLLEQTKETSETTEETIESGEAPIEVESVDTDLGKMIPRSRYNDVSKKYQAERDEKIKLAAELNQYKQMMEQGLIQQPQKKAEVVQQEQEPDAELFPEQNQIFHLKKTVEELKTQMGGVQQSTEQQQQQTVINNLMNQATQEIRSKGEEAMAAYDYYLDVKIAELTPFADNEQDLQNRVHAHFVNLAATAAYKKLSPSEIFIGLAKKTGFQGVKKAGAAAQPDLAAIERNKKASASVTGSGTEPAGITAGSFSIADVMRENGRGVDPKKFQKSLQKLASA